MADTLDYLGNPVPLSPDKAPSVSGGGGGPITGALASAKDLAPTGEGGGSFSPSPNTFSGQSGVGIQSASDFNLSSPLSDVTHAIDINSAISQGGKNLAAVASPVSSGVTALASGLGFNEPSMNIPSPFAGGVGGRISMADVLGMIAGAVAPGTGPAGLIAGLPAGVQGLLDFLGYGPIANNEALASLAQQINAGQITAEDAVNSEDMSTAFGHNNQAIQDALAVPSAAKIAALSEGSFTSALGNAPAGTSSGAGSGYGGSTSLGAGFSVNTDGTISNANNTITGFTQNTADVNAGKIGQQYSALTPTTNPRGGGDEPDAPPDDGGPAGTSGTAGVGSPGPGVGVSGDTGEGSGGGAPGGEAGAE